MTFDETKQFLERYDFVLERSDDETRTAIFKNPDSFTYLTIRISDEIGEDYVKQLANRFFAENTTRKTLMAMFANNNTMVQEVGFTEDDDIMFKVNNLGGGGITEHTLSESYPELHKKFHHDLIHSLSTRTAEQVTKRLQENP